MDLQDLVSQENLQLQKLADLVKNSIDEEQMLTSRLIAIEQDQNISWGQKLSDKVADFGGSWFFIVSFFAVLIFWILLNLSYFNDQPFDPYPFILLNLILSCVAAIQAPIIMMSQNRKEDKDRRRSRSDFMINLKAEMEVRNLHAKIDLLITEQMKVLFSIQKTQTELLQKIERSVEILTTKN